MKTQSATRVITYLAILAAFACFGGDRPAPVDGGSPAPTATDVATASEHRAAEPPALVAEMMAPFHGDFDAMVEKRVIRVLVTYNKTNFFLDRGTQKGITADFLREFEKSLNKELRLGRRPLHLAAIPVLRDQLIPFLEQGRGDIAAASLTITPERAQRVLFSVPARRNVGELVVTGPGSPALSSLDDLAGKRVFVRASSSYWESLQALDRDLREQNLEPLKLVAVDEVLDAEDLLEQVSAGNSPATVVDTYQAEFWSRIYPDLVLHPESYLRYWPRIVASMAYAEHVGW